ncbi:hypothetical protein LEP1GSC062_2614 [Leptospira alexanderi serovar Manhao 3 str. L 60]|uniref:Uncharacterized protein n=1 Tax=Leptospira alexanderi serovar Manhao 3 str. L 60 TaxID=1049759 RepID=V6HWX3_9LEPT|nr:hypothetical protein LEP1GSC062_2614 [Leptospira alexanderi serovar Manhao 3 str. L 60]
MMLFLCIVVEHILDEKIFLFIHLSLLFFYVLPTNKIDIISVESHEI